MEAYDTLERLGDVIVKDRRAMHAETLAAGKQVEQVWLVICSTPIPLHDSYPRSTIRILLSEVMCQPVKWRAYCVSSLCVP